MEYIRTCYNPALFDLQNDTKDTSNICCPRDCVSRHNGGTAGDPLNPSETIVLSEHYHL